MIETIKGISIQGRCFSSPTNFKFFQGADDRISIIYGKNGSGKSTISEGIHSLASENCVSDITASLSDDNGNPILLDKPAESIFVFNENYTDRNVKIDDDGLGAIVLLGGQVDLQAEIESYEQLETEENSVLEKRRESYEEYSKSNNPVSPTYHWERIKTTLKQPGGWAEVDSQIKNLRRNSSVTDDVIKEICNLTTTLTLSELQTKFEHNKQLLSKISDPSIAFPDEIKQVPMPNNIDQTICVLLAKQIEQPILTEREKMILSVVRNGRQADIEAARVDFSNPQTTICPYCYQPTDEEYKQELINSINRVLNKDVDMHKEELLSVSFPNVTFSSVQYDSLNSELAKKIISAVNQCNDKIAQYQSLIEMKRKNIYTPKIIEHLGLEKSIIHTNQLLAELETKRKEFNDIARRSKAIQNELLSINKLIAHLKTASIYKDYLNQVKAEKKAKDAWSTQNEKASKISAQLKELQQRKTNIGLAIGSINNALDYVFFTHGRLSIELKNDKYYLKSNGQDVRPKNVSLGERNIIALCYFFTQIMQNQEITKLYKREQLVVIDDPISSFDFENKVGILSFLRYQISKIITGNNISKVVLLSHDLSTIFDLQKAMDEICQYTKGEAKVCNTNFSWLELSQGKLTRFLKSRSEYAELLKAVYAYAENPMSNINIGNTMRRVLEAFSTFTYRKNINDVSCNANVLGALGEHSIYFENLMYRLVLHNESHFEEQIYNLHDDASFYNFISEAEKQRTSKDILCFMYILNPSHIIAYLGVIPHATENIKSWCKLIPNNTSFEIKDNVPRTAVIQRKKRTIPLFDLRISAGTGNDIFDGRIPSEDFPTNNMDCDFALRVSGDSMEPDIPDESIVLIRKCESLDEGKPGAIFYNGNIYCKKLTQNESGTYLISINSAYKPIKITSDDMMLYGEVIGIE